MGDSGGRRTAVVVGGGIGGLTAALGLVRIGWDVTVLERAPVLAGLGAGISLWTNALRCLDQLGVGAEVRARGTLQGGGGMRTPTGRWVTRSNTEELERRLGAGIVALHRADLHRILRDALPPGCLVTGAEVTEVAQGGPNAGNRVAVTYDTATGPARVEADLAVAADGLNSRIRALLWPEIPGPAYSGYTSWRGVTEKPFTPAPEAVETWGRGERFGFLPLADGRVYWFAVANCPPGLRYDDEHGEVRRRFGAWHDPIPAVLDATRPESVLHHDICELAGPLPTYVKGRVALLGDAAHVMTPNLGQGACQAIEDSVVLAAAIAAETGLAAALERYDRERRPRSQAISLASRRIGRLAQLDGRLSVALRYLVLRLTPQRAALRSIGGVADWTPPALP